MSSCGNYVENVWRKGKCANCFGSKLDHSTTQVKNGGARNTSSTDAQRATNGINGYSKYENKTVKGLDDDGFDNPIIGKSTNATKGLKSGSISTSVSLDETGNSRRENTPDHKEDCLEDFKKDSKSPERPKPAPKPRARGFSCGSSSSQEDILINCGSSSSDCSRSNTTTPDVLEQNINNGNLNAWSSPDVETNHMKDSLNGLDSNVERSKGTHSSGDSQTISRGGASDQDSNGRIIYNTRHSDSVSNGSETGKVTLNDLTTKRMNEIEEDGGYVPMKNNVCEVNGGRDKETRLSADENRPATDKISKQSLSVSLVDRSAEDALAENTEQDLGSQLYVNQGIKSDGSSEPLIGVETRGISDMSSVGSCSGDVIANDTMEPYYENQLSMESEKKESCSSASSLANGQLCVTTKGSGITLSSDDASVDDTSPVFEGDNKELSGSSTSSSSSASSSDSSSNSNNSAQNEKSVLFSADEERRAEHQKRKLDPEMVKKRQSNPDIKSAIEGPQYMNAKAKPVAKPYKVVDISSGVLYREDEVDQPEIPPLPPKERELNQIQEDEDKDHYYHEPPEDIVPDYKKLTPVLGKEPAPEFDIKKGRAGLNNLPIPRPRSQLHVSTLPRPVPRAKTAKDLVAADQTVRPVSQACRLQTPGSPEQNKQEEGADTLSREQQLKPTRSAPPPPMGTRSSSPKPKDKLSVHSPTSAAKHPPAATKQQVHSPPSVTKTGHTISASTKTQDSKGTLKAAVKTSPATKTYGPPATGTTSKEQDQASMVTVQVEGCSTTHQVKMRHLDGEAHSGWPSPKSGFRRALSSWKRLSGRRKGKRKLEISSPILVNEEIPSFAVQQDTLRKRISTTDSSQAVCTSIRELQEEKNNGNETPSPDTKDNTEGTTSPEVPVRKPGHSYQNFPFSKAGSVEKPSKPERGSKCSKPVQEVKPHEVQVQEDPAYLEPCVDSMTIKVETALANLNDAQILAEALSRVEQEKLGPLPDVPKSKHVHFGATEGARAEGKPACPPKRPIRAVCPTIVNGVAEKKKPPRPQYPSLPTNSKVPDPPRGRSKSMGATHAPSIPEPPRNRSVSIQSNPTKSHYSRILEMHVQTLREVIATSRGAFLPGDNIDLSSTRWGDYVVCGDPLTVRAPGAVLLPVKCSKVEDELPLLARVKYPKAVTEDMSQRAAFMQDMSVTVSIPSHVNVARIVAHFTDTLPGHLFGIDGDSDWETLVTISDQHPVESVAEFLERTREEHKENPDAYERNVCVLMIQLFAALDHLHSEGIVHRDLNAENLLLLDAGNLIVANFGNILQQPKETTSRFFYKAEKVIQSSGSHPPPEIVNCTADTGTVDLERCDAFAAGCLMYELLHEVNPFASNSKLICSEYSVEELPQLPERSRFTCGIGAIASGLLERNPSERMLPREALQLLQAFLWGPEELDNSCLDDSARDWLETERACAVVGIARSQTLGKSPWGDDFVENFLKYEYLVGTCVEEVVNGFKALAPLDTLNDTL
ncbi:uncharacterized protein LOC5522167 isoform X2 [Nematostella vectensis]|uniref:uncharacterized protein LOC5522167 isoform X2 n=1 Tax=Nematostella vectensis TaxID=45351 RepID=UPI00138FC546|nr:uncharacterized protein LOC5522167 isoform X2 [Nematostella vectensis]